MYLLWHTEYQSNSTFKLNSFFEKTRLYSWVFNFLHPNNAICSKSKSKDRLFSLICFL
jgi:hypothetical protein